MAKTSALAEATGRDRAGWFKVLDKWGAAGRPYREIADHLTGKHGLSRWWAQKLVVEYEQERGLRAPGVRRDGSFEVTATKTVAVPVDRVFEAFVDPRRRKRWLPEGGLKLRDSEPGVAARFDYAGGSRVNVMFERKGSKAMVAVAHNKLPNQREAEKTKAMWRESLAELKSLLES